MYSEQVISCSKGHYVVCAELLPDELVQALFELYLTSQGCVLLLVLKQHLKDMYGFTDR